MSISNYLPIWDKLSQQEKDLIEQSCTPRTAKAGEYVHGGGNECTGLLVIKSGQLRAYILSDEGKEVTLYRLLEGDICLFSASCAMKSIQFDITVVAEKDTEFWMIPSETYRELMESSVAISNYTNEIMASRMSDIMWLMEQIIWQSFDKRLATFLIEESSLEQSRELAITHDAIANHLGTAREVVTRMLKHFKSDGLIELTRGKIKILDIKKLSSIID